MYQKRSLNVIPLILTALVFVVSFAFIVSAPVSASNAGDALFPDDGEAGENLVLDENLVIETGGEQRYGAGEKIGFTLSQDVLSQYEPVYIPVSSLMLYMSSVDISSVMVYRNHGDLTFHVLDGDGLEYDFVVPEATYENGQTKSSFTFYNSNGVGTATTIGGVKLDSDSQVYVKGYYLDFNPFASTFGYRIGNSYYEPLDLYYDIPSGSSYHRWVYGHAVALLDGTQVYDSSGNVVLSDGVHYIGFPSFSVTAAERPFSSLYSYTSSELSRMVTGTFSGASIPSSGTVYTVYDEVIGSDVSQRLYIIKDDEAKKYYLWLFRNNYGSSLILEGKATASLPTVTITNGGRYYTDNFFTSLDMYDAFGVAYDYNVQITAFDTESSIKKFTYNFGAESLPGPDDDTTPITPPGQIEIPDIIGGVVSTPGELPSLYLPFDFESPTLTVDFTSGFDYAFNSTWLGVSDVYRDVTTFVDGLVVKFVPDVSGVFGSIVYTVETYADSFRDMCRDMRNTYAVPFYNLVVKISSLVPAPVWVVFDIWLFYCSARLIIYVFTCPLSDVIRRYF